MRFSLQSFNSGPFTNIDINSVEKVEECINELTIRVLHTTELGKPTTDFGRLGSPAAHYYL
jgi:hypothetical protein